MLIGNSSVQVYTQLHWCFVSRLCGEFEEIAQKALTTPANTKELMELKAYIQKVESETMYALESKLVHAKSTLVFLIEYTNISPAEMRSNADTLTWYDRMPSIFDEHRAIVAEKRTQYEEALKVCRRRHSLCGWFIMNSRYQTIVIQFKSVTNRLFAANVFRCVTFWIICLCQCNTLI